MTKRQRREVFAAYEVKWGIHYIITYILRNIGAPCMYVCMYVCMLRIEVVSKLIIFFNFGYKGIAKF